MSSRRERLAHLKKTGEDFLRAEKTRLADEEASLKAVLEGRTGGVRAASTKRVSSLAQNELAEFLKGG